MFLKIISSISTNNFQDQNMMEKISHLWQEHQKEVEEAFAQGLPIYAVYHDYVSDYKGDYSLSLCSLSNKEDWDFDTSGQTYQVFEVDTSDSKGHLHTWQRIWQAEEARELQRQYSIDFEKYEPDQTVSIFIATPNNG